VAEEAGAIVIATAGSTEKRELLRALGVKHVMDSRSLAFADKIRALTHGRGVDLVLNSLSGRAIEASLSLLAPGGRFLEIGKRDIYQNARIGLRPFRNNVSLQAIDLRQVMDQRPELVARELREVVKRIESGRYHALPYRAFPMHRVVDAFRHLSRARHVGKVIVTTSDARVMAQPAADRRPPQLKPDATYMITGGLGGFGLAVAEWLVERGARHLLLTGRRGAATAEAQAALASFTARGVAVVAEAGDITRADDVERTFARIAANMPPLKGIMHAAMVLDDGLLTQLDPSRVARVMAPKVAGAWNLHRATLALDLDFFVLFSSMAELVGNAGQANYVAANSFLVALAHQRHAMGLPALAIDWGRISDVGYVDRNADVAQRLERLGILGMPAARATEALGRLLACDAPHIGLLRMDWQAWARTSGGKVSTRLSELVTSSSESAETNKEGLREAVLAASESDRQSLVVEMLREQVAQVLRSSAGDLDPKRPLTELGLDSLMAIDLVNRIESAFGVTVPSGRVAAQVTIIGLAETLLELIAGRPSATSTIAAAANGNGHAAIDEAPASCLVAMRPGGTRPPLFLVHAAGGLAASYARLVFSLPADLPAIAIQSRAVDADRAEFDSIEAMAEAYAGLLAKRQPEGPLHLLGFSFGGFVALTAAAILEKAGREVAMVALLDANPSWADADRPRRERAREIVQEVMTTLVRDLGLIPGVDAAELARSAETLFAGLVDASEAEGVEQIMAWLKRRDGLAAGPQVDRVERVVRLMVRHIKLVDGHDIASVRAPIRSWRARGGEAAKAGDWSSYTTGSFREERLDCSHYEILQPPHVGKVATSLDLALREIAAGAAIGEDSTQHEDRRPRLQVHG
jgi:thioesterase domain-containing protein/NADPH:quinone reductase-like Zn-dependent oxidoreductase/acyl carrier protein